MMVIKAVMFSFLFGSLIRLIGGEQRGINSTGIVDSVGISIIYVNPKKH